MFLLRPFDRLDRLGIPSEHLHVTLIVLDPALLLHAQLILQQAELQRLETGCRAQVVPERHEVQRRHRLQNRHLIHQ